MGRQALDKGGQKDTASLNVVHLRLRELSGKFDITHICARRDKVTGEKRTLLSESVLSVFLSQDVAGVEKVDVPVHGLDNLLPAHQCGGVGRKKRGTDLLSADVLHAKKGKEHLFRRKGECLGVNL